MSVEIDEEYEEEQQKQFEQQLVCQEGDLINEQQLVCQEEDLIIEQQLVCQEEDLINKSYSNPIDFTEELLSSSTPGRTECYNKRTLLLSTSLNQLEKECQKHIQKETEADSMRFPRPEIRKARHMKENVKDAIATVSYRCAASIPKGHIAFQTVCDKMYGHRYYLSPGRV